jgi:hypothetical protein
MSNFKRDIVNAMELGESIEAIQVMEHMGCEAAQAHITEGIYEGQDVKRCLDLLDYEYDDGYGSPNCHRVYIYTKTRVHFIHEYDGSTQVRSVPRHPKVVNHRTRVKFLEARLAEAHMICDEMENKLERREHEITILRKSQT